MSTRGAFGFICKGKEYITYNHFDSYPDGLGKDVLEFFNSDFDSSKVESLKAVDLNVKPTPDQIKELLPYADISVSSGELTEWYVLLRKTQGNLEAILECGYFIDSKDFLVDSLFCEFAYIINLDTNRLECYEGSNKHPEAEGRYSKGNPCREYKGVKLVGELTAGQTLEDMEKLYNKEEEEIF